MRPAYLSVCVLFLATACESSGAYANRPIPELQSAVMEAHVQGVGYPILVPLEVFAGIDEAPECDDSSPAGVWFEWVTDGARDQVLLESCSGAIDEPWASSVGLTVEQRRSPGDVGSWVDLTGDAELSFEGKPVTSFPPIATTGETKVTAVIETYCSKEYCAFVDVLVVSLTVVLDGVQ